MTEKQRPYLTGLAICMLIVGVYLLHPWPYSEKSAATNSTVAQERETVVEPKRQPESEASLRQRVEWEEQRLAQLQSAFSGVEARQASVDEAQGQIQDLNTRLSAIEQRLGQLKNENVEIVEAHKTFQRGQRMEENSVAIDTENQLQRIDTDLYNLRLQRNQVASANPQAIDAEITGLELAKSQLLSAQRNAQRSLENDTLAGEQDAQNELVDVRTESQNLLRERDDLMANRDYWQRQVAAVSGDENLRLDRMRTLEAQIAGQEKRISSLRLQLAGE